jgi:hypothetical protein
VCLVQVLRETIRLPELSAAEMKAPAPNGAAKHAPPGNGAAHDNGSKAAPPPPPYCCPYPCPYCTLTPSLVPTGTGAAPPGPATL